MSLLQVAHQSFLDAQRLYRYTQSSKFKEIYNDLCIEDKIEINKLMTLKAVKEFISSHRDITQQPVMKLRAIAKDLGIGNYNYLTKASLLFEINNVRRNEDSNNQNRIKLRKIS